MRKVVLAPRSQEIIKGEQIYDIKDELCVFFLRRFLASQKFQEFTESCRKTSTGLHTIDRRVHS